MDEAQEILSYLPLRFRKPSNKEYIEFLWDSFCANYEKGKFAFAYIAFHMLYMCYIYSVIWKIKRCKCQDFKNALIGFGGDETKKIEDSDDLFIFHIINERKVFNFLKLIGFGNDQIGKFNKMVENRNLSAHSNGVIFFKNQKSLDDEIARIIECVRQIHSGTNSVILSILVEFLDASWNIENIEYDNYEDEINEVFISQNTLSQSDLQVLLKLDSPIFDSEINAEEKKELFELIKHQYAELIL